MEAQTRLVTDEKLTHMEREEYPRVNVAIKIFCEESSAIVKFYLKDLCNNVLRFMAHEKMKK